MKVSDPGIVKTNRERSPMKKNTGNESSNRVPNSQSTIKVERTLKAKNNLQSETTLTERKSRESVKKSRRTDKPTEVEVKESSPSRKPWVSSTRRPSKPKLPPAVIQVELSLAEASKIHKKIPHSYTPDSSDTEKTKLNVKLVNKKKSEVSPTVTKVSTTGKTDGGIKRTKVTLKRQLALDNVPTNLKESFSVSEESLNSITSVTQLLKIERSSYTFNSSSNNSNSANDDEDEDIATGGVKSLAARWQARNENTLSAKQNGILKKNDSVRSNKTNDDDMNSTKTKLYEAIRQNGLLKESMTTGFQDKEKEAVLAIKSTSKDSKSSVSSQVAHVPLSSSSSLPKSPQLKEKKKNVDKLPPPTMSEASSPLLSAAAAAVAVSGKPMERKIKRTKTLPRSSSTSSPSSAAAALTSKLTSGVATVTTTKRAEELSVPTTARKESLVLNKPSNRARSRSTSPIKSSTLANIPTSNKPATPPPEVVAAAAATTLLLLSRGRSTNRRSTVDTTTPHTNPSTKSFSYDQQHPQPRRSRSVSSTPGLPSYAAATTTSLAKQTNQIRDHKEESTGKASNKSVSYHKSHLINANASSSAVLTAASSSDARGQGQQKNVVPVKSKNRIRDSHSPRKSDPQQIASSTKNATTVPTSSSSNTTGIKTFVNSLSPVSLSSSSTATSPTRKISNASKVSSNDKKDSKSRLVEIGSTPKSDVRGKTDWRSKTNNSGVAIGRNSVGSRKREEPSFSSSSVASPSSPRKASLETVKRNAAELQQQRIIPSIIMSEYVDEDNKDGKTTVLAHTKSLFIPLQFIEPLQSACDIEEGSSLELKVRVKGAEAVIWVKENKIIPNAPPDFEYFQEKANDLYGLRIADAFLEDSGLYICEAYGAGGREITCWCEVDVLETGANVDDDEVDTSWEDLNMSDEIKTPKPLVVPVIVTSQAEQDSEPSPSFETAMAKEPSPIRTVTVKEIDIDDEGHFSRRTSLNNQRSSQSCTNENNDVGDCDQLIENKQQYSSSYHHQNLKKTSRNESAFPKSFAVAEQIKNEDDLENRQGAAANHRVKSQSCWASPTKQVTKVNYKTGEGMTGETVTEFASPSITKESRLTHAKEMKCDFVTDAATVSIIIPAEADHLVKQSDTNHSRHLDSVKRQLTGELSSASDESIYLKERRLGDEGVLSSAEERSISLDLKSSVANNEDTPTITSEDSSFLPMSSPSSEHNERSSSIDSAIGLLGRPLFIDGKFPPRILVGPSNIIALYDEVVHLRVKVQTYGIPKTSVNWFKFVNGTYKKIELNSGDQSSSQGDAHMSITKCGTALNTLTITRINYDDCGRYRVKVQNLLGMDSHDCLLTVEGPPEPPGTPPKVKYDDKSKTILIQWSSCPYDGGSKITGYYVEASVVQGSKTAINRDDIDNWQLLTPQSYSWLCYTYTNPKRGSVYRFRVFGENSYGRGKPTDPSLPLMVPVLMEGRRAGSSDALLWSLKPLSPDETSLRKDTTRKLVREQGGEFTAGGDSALVQEEEEPSEYKNVTIKRESFYNVYEKLEELGKGRFGIVFDVQQKETKKIHAGKFVKCIKAKDKERVQLEVKIMNDLGYHPKLICLIDAFEMPREIVIVTQRISGGELFERVVADDFTLTEGDCITFLRQICDAVRFIHGKNIMHLDLKPENILCTSKHSNLVKIIDFGLAQYYDPQEPLRVLFGTAEFVSPEIINYEPIAPSTDNWSVGVITYILLSGLSPFMGDNDNETFSNITRAEFDFEDEAFEKISDDAKDFISNLIVKRPEKRLTAEQCLSHRWLKQDVVESKKGVILPTDKLKRFLVRRKWQKTGNAIRALSRMTTLYSRRSSSASSTPTGSLSLSSPPPPSSYRSGSLALQESPDDNVFFPHPSNSPDNNFNSTIFNCNNNRPVVNDVEVVDTKMQTIDGAKSPTSKPKFSDPSRSDSGVCDVGSFSSSLNYD